jgi:L-alanine-DL-glutamate epimerase-like enolase superfamily enzyme
MSLPLGSVKMGRLSQRGESRCQKNLFLLQCCMEKIRARVVDLQAANPWKIASSEGSDTQQTVILELSDGGTDALGEAAPSVLYGETAAEVCGFLQGVDHRHISFGDIPGSMKYLSALPGIPVAAKCALNLALLDGAARRAGQSLNVFLGLGFRENHHVSSFSIGIDVPEIIHKKVLEAAAFPVLKLKVGDARDRENLAALRAAAPRKPVRVDANEGWKTREEALRMLEWLAATDDNIQFVEQPMPRATPMPDWKWLKARSPLPLFADESCHTVADITRCAEAFHGINVKLVKTGGVSMAYDTLQAARKCGLKTMIGCMLETSVQISAAAHLAELADYLDLDGNLLITNDPFVGVTAKSGILSFADAKEKSGLQASPRG